MISSGKAVIAANSACAASVQKTGKVDSTLCGVNTQKAKKAYDEARMTVTKASPATDAIGEQVNASVAETFGVVMKHSR
ncbi:hypothetical protein [Xylophilus sp. Leaf220]|uniref:hypothetical protein n=1 Tax=Xylophilus sp. Leaf220 TaxID=1735686 RepID=UPI0012E1450C|nr:hypothetical protein [Xylophilus sp. Leaf220]